jgi:hypothetical protein
MNFFRQIVFYFFVIIFISPLACIAGDMKISKATKSCLECHEMAHPGIVEDWKKSRHSKTTVDEALKKTGLERRVSVEKAPSSMSEVVVGYAECHTRQLFFH